MRASNCAKFIFKQGMKRFHSYEWGYAYHGTKVENVVSIIENGLKSGNTVLPNGTLIPMANGNAYGDGIYTSRIPFYAECYAPVVEYNGNFFQTVFLVRIDTNSLKLCGYCECGNRATIDTFGYPNIHELYGGLVKINEV